MTSNLGSHFLVDTNLDRHQKESAVMATVQTAFKPEFLNRIDDILIFDALERKEISRIMELLVDDLQKRLSERHIQLTLDDRAKSWLMESGFDPQYGARPLRRTIQKAIGDPLAMKILAGEIPDGSEVHITAASPEAANLEITLAV